MDIIENKYTLSDESMLKQCKVFHNVMFQKVKIKTGRGRGIKVNEVFKYSSEDDEKIRNRIKNSINWYSMP